MTTPEIAARLSPAAPRIEYLPLPPGHELPPNVLFAVTFGDDGSIPSARCVHVPLEPLIGVGLAEVWYANGAVTSGITGPVRYAADDYFQLGIIEVDEHDHGGIVQATEFVYRAIAEFQMTSRYAHLLRTWNYLDAINFGSGDAERYRGFCSGRVAGLTTFRQTQFPAATVIGRQDGERRLQVYWLAGREPGVALENPRQLSAYHYPRQYGPTSPTFSRAILVAPDLLIVSGTASIVGHASQHADSVEAQIAEILANLDSLLSCAHQHAPALPAGFARNTLIKAYVRSNDYLPAVERALRARLPAGATFLVLLGDVCRGELLVEFDCLQAAS